MPLNVVKTPRDEHKWKRAEEIAAKAGQAGNYAYIMGIYKKMKPEYKFKKTAKVIAHIAGPSGAGKTTILDKLRKINPSLVVKDLDTFDSQGREVLWGTRHIRSKSFTDEMRSQLYAEKERLLSDFLAKHKDKKVVLGGHHIHGPHTSTIPEGEKILLDTGALRSAWRNVRRSKKGVGRQKLYRDIIFGRESPTGAEGALWAIGSKDIQQLRSMGYTPKSPKEILSLVEKTAGARTDDLVVALRKVLAEKPKPDHIKGWSRHSAMNLGQAKSQLMQAIGRKKGSWVQKPTEEMKDAISSLIYAGLPPTHHTAKEMKELLPYGHRSWYRYGKGGPHPGTTKKANVALRTSRGIVSSVPLSRIQKGVPLPAKKLPVVDAIKTKAYQVADSGPGKVVKQSVENLYNQASGQQGMGTLPHMANAPAMAAGGAVGKGVGGQAGKGYNFIKQLIEGAKWRAVGRYSGVSPEVQHYMNRAAKENVQKQLPSHIARGQTAGNVAGQIGGAVFPFERGGIVRKPTRAVLGEKGKPEAVIPLSSDKRSKRDRRKILEEAIKIVEKEKTASISYANRRPLVYDSLPVILRLR